MASSQRGSLAAISPTKPRSGAVRFLRARKIRPSPPERPTAGWPSAPSAATRPLFTRPAKTISAASRVSASVTRRPSMNSLCLPSAFSVRVNCTPPPCTTATWLPSRTRSAMARVQPSSSDGVSRPAPPNLTTYFISSPPRRISFETFRFRPAAASHSDFARPGRTRPSANCRGN